MEIICKQLDKNGSINEQSDSLTWDIIMKLGMFFTLLIKAIKCISDAKHQAKIMNV